MRLEACTTAVSITSSINGLSAIFSRRGGASWARPIFERLDAQVDGAIERGDELRREALHRRIIDHRQAVGNQLRGGEQIAQVMAHLADRKAESGEMVLLLQAGRKARSASHAIRARPRRSRRAAGPAR